jgi:hypothetical protein
MEELRRAFRPEFLNRLDETIIFHRLGEGKTCGIVDIQLQGFEQAARAPRPQALAVDDAAKDYLGEIGWDPVYGARPLKRAIQQQGAVDHRLGDGTTGVGLGLEDRLVLVLPCRPSSGPSGQGASRRSAVCFSIVRLVLSTRRASILLVLR